MTTPPPPSEDSAPSVHQRKKRKNYAVLGLIVFWIALIWIVTMIKLGF